MASMRLAEARIGDYGQVLGHRGLMNDPTSPRLKQRMTSRHSAERVGDVYRGHHGLLGFHVTREQLPADLAVC